NPSILPDNPAKIELPIVEDIEPGNNQPKIETGIEGASFFERRSGEHGKPKEPKPVRDGPGAGHQQPKQRNPEGAGHSRPFPDIPTKEVPDKPDCDDQRNPRR